MKEEKEERQWKDAPLSWPHYVQRGFNLRFMSGSQKCPPHGSPPFLPPTALAPVWPKERPWKPSQEKPPGPLDCWKSPCVHLLCKVLTEDKALQAVCPLPETRPHASTSSILVSDFPGLLLPGCRPGVHVYPPATFPSTGRGTLASQPAGSTCLPHRPLESPLSEAVVQLLSIFFSFVLLGPHPQHMKVPRLGVKLELQAYATATATPDPSRVCDLHSSSWQHWILNPLREARDPTRVLMGTRWVCYGRATMGTPSVHF